MSLRTISLVIAVAFAAAAPALSDAAAQSTPAPKWVEPPAEVPKPQKGDRTRNIDFLLGALKVAPDDESAKAIEHRIWALWLVSGSDTADLLMSRARKAIDDKNLDLAIRLLSEIIEIRPNYTEAWNRRATLYYMKKDYTNAIADLEHVLALEPRHFGALAGLGTMLEEIGDDKFALDAYRRALAIYPRLEGVSEHVKELTLKVDGRDI